MEPLSVSVSGIGVVDEAIAVAIAVTGRDDARTITSWLILGILSERVLNF